MKRERTSQPLHSMLRRQGEPTLRYRAEMSTALAEKLEQEAVIERERARRYLEKLEQEAAIERERARRYLEAADLSAAEKRTRNKAHRVRQKAGRNTA